MCFIPHDKESSHTLHLVELKVFSVLFCHLGQVVRHLFGLLGRKLSHLYTFLLVQRTRNISKDTFHVHYSQDAPA